MLRGDELVDISDEERYDETGHHVLLKRHRQAVRIQRLDIAAYIPEEVYTRLSQFLGTQYIFCDIGEKLSKDLVKLMRQQGLQYSRRIMNVFFRAVGNPPGANVTSIFETEDGREVVSSRCFLIITDGCHRLGTIEMLKQEAGFLTTNGRCHVHHLMRLDDVCIQHSEAKSSANLRIHRLPLVGETRCSYP